MGSRRWYWRRGKKTINILGKLYIWGIRNDNSNEMKKDYYYEVSEKATYRKCPIRFIGKTGDFYKVYFPLERVVQELKDNIQYRELVLTNTHLERMGYIAKNNQLAPVDDYFLIPQYAIGQSLDISFLGYYLINEQEVKNYRSEYKSKMEKYIKGEIKLNVIKKKFPGIYNINDLIKRLKDLGIPLSNPELIISGDESKNR